MTDSPFRLPPLSSEPSSVDRWTRRGTIDSPDRSVDANRMIWLAYRDTLRAASTEPRKAPTHTTDETKNKHSTRTHSRLRTKDLQREAHDAALRLACVRARLEFDMGNYMTAKQNEIRQIKIVKCNHTGKRMHQM